MPLGHPDRQFCSASVAFERKRRHVTANPDRDRGQITTSRTTDPSYGEYIGVLFREYMNQPPP
jgi:hypothetical protein